MPHPMLKVENLKTYYGQSQALFGVNLEIYPGEAVTLLGRNGMGKTTTVHSITGIVPGHTGNVFFDGRQLIHEPTYRIARLGTALVPEGRQVFPNLSVRENLQATAANRLGHANPWNLDRVLAMFPSLQPRLEFMSNLLSGGEQQMLAIGRALMTNPRLLLLDDATEGLAPMVREEIWRCLAELKSSGLALLVVDKNIQDLLNFADRHYVLEKGKVAWSGDSGALAADVEIQHRYLGI